MGLFEVYLPAAALCVMTIVELVIGQIAWAKRLALRPVPSLESSPSVCFSDRQNRPTHSRTPGSTEC